MSLTQADIIKLTLKSEGGYGIDNNGAQVYCGINQAYNSDWSGWVIINRWVASLGGSKNARYKKSADPELERLVDERIIKNYWNGHNFDKYTDGRVVAQLFDHIYNAGSGGLNSVLKNAFNGATQSTAPAIANADSQAVQKVVQARKAFYSQCKWHTDDLKKRENYTKVAYRRVDEICSATGSPQFANPVANINNIQNDGGMPIQQQLLSSSFEQMENIYFRERGKVCTTCSLPPIV